MLEKAYHNLVCIFVIHFVQGLKFVATKTLERRNQQMNIFLTINVLKFRTPKFLIKGHM